MAQNNPDLAAPRTFFDGRGLVRNIITRRSWFIAFMLIISRSIIESHGGRVRAESGRDGGATLRYTLKVNEQQIRRHERADSLHS